MRFPSRPSSIGIALLALFLVAPPAGAGASYRNLLTGDTTRLHNIPASPDFIGVCANRGPNSRACIRAAVLAIEHARSFEHMRRHALVLPDNFRRLTIAEQTFVITDLERVDRGLRPYAGMTAHLDTVAHGAATGRVDPSLATFTMHTMHVKQYGSVWAGDFGPLASDYDWMYNDGYSKGGQHQRGLHHAERPGLLGSPAQHPVPGHGLPDAVSGSGQLRLGGFLDRRDPRRG